MTDEPMINLQVRIPVELLKWIDEFRSKSKSQIRLSRAQMIRWLLETGRANIATTIQEPPL